MSNLVEIKKQITSPQMLSQFKLALPAHITPEKFQRVAMTALLHNPDLKDCSVPSVMTSLLKCAQDGLLPDNREAALVKFAGNAQYMPMVYGLIKRMRNSGSVTNVNAYCVYANDSVLNGFNSGTITNQYGVYIANPPSSGTLTNNYGLYIENQTRGGSLNYAIYSAGGLCYFAGPVRINQNSSTSGIVTIGGASNSGAYVSVSTSSQAANDKLISVSMAGSITGTLYAADISMTATTNVLTRITNTENATATSNCELQLVTGGASGGDPFIHFNISGNTDWSLGADNSDSDKLVIAASTALGISNALTITTAGLVTFTGSIVITGKQKNLTVSTGAGSALLGANSPAATLTAPFEWINVTLSDGSTGYIPAWK